MSKSSGFPFLECRFPAFWKRGFRAQEYTQLNITPVDNKKFRVKVDAAVSQTFFGWVFQYNGGITIVEPVDVKQQYEDMLNRALRYSESINLD